MKPDLKLVENTGSQLESDELGELPPQQSEMPFAVVEGEPMTELPRDLYIPPDALQVFLEAFEGPLDLLLYLIRRQNLDILDIPIAEITRQYMKYIEVMADLQLELAGEYLLMAAMLAEIKSRMLLPRPPSADGQEEEDPRAELVRRLQEYERFKKAAEDIDRLTRLERDTMPASAELSERKVIKIQPQVSLQEMLLAFKDVLSRAEMFAHHHVSRERLSVRQRMSDILSTLREVAFMEFTHLFRAEEGRMGVTVTFIGILELMKEGLIEIVQAEAYAPIHVRTAQGARHLTVVQGGVIDADAENEAALAQPAHPDENDLPDEEEPEQGEPEAEPEAAAPEGAEVQASGAGEESAEAMLDDAQVEETLTENVDEAPDGSAVDEASAEIVAEASDDAADADLSTDDDSVTRDAGETDNPDAEPSK
jgi:segregation and condensation protein A